MSKSKTGLLLILPTLLILGFLVSVDHTEAYSYEETLTPKQKALFAKYNRPKVVEVKYRNKSIKQYITTASTVEDFLQEIDLSYSLADTVYSNTDKVITDHTRIDIIWEQVKTVTVTEEIPAPVETVYTADLEIGQTKIKQKGQAGEIKIVKKQFFQNNQLLKEEILSKNKVKDPQKQIKLIGTSQPVHTTTINGQTIRYTKTLRVWATSYDHTCAGCSHYTATGEYLTHGIVAVDPRVIPMHTRMYVPGYGFGQAEDVGGAVKGNHIDLGFEDLSKASWSARWVTIYILAD